MIQVTYFPWITTKVLTRKQIKLTQVIKLRNLTIIFSCSVKFVKTTVCPKMSWWIVNKNCFLNQSIIFSVKYVTYVFRNNIHFWKTSIMKSWCWLWLYRTATHLANFGMQIHGVLSGKSWWHFPVVPQIFALNNILLMN